MDHSLLFHLL